MADGIEEQLTAVEKGLADVGELLKSTPTNADIQALNEKIDGAIEKSAGSGLSLDSFDIESIIDAAVEKAVGPLNEKIEELEDGLCDLEESPVVKGIQDFDLAKAAAQKTEEGGKVDTKDFDVMKSVIATSYPETKAGY